METKPYQDLDERLDSVTQEISMVPKRMLQKYSLCPLHNTSVVFFNNVNTTRIQKSSIVTDPNFELSNMLLLVEKTK